MPTTVVDAEARPVRDLLACLRNKIPGSGIKYIMQLANDMLIKGKHYKEHPKDEDNKKELKCLKSVQHTQDENSYQKTFRRP